MRINSGDVIEFDGPNGATTALVLLESNARLVIDLLDGSIPQVVGDSDLRGLRIFDPGDALGAAA